MPVKRGEEGIRFRQVASSDLILLEFWNKTMGDKKVVRMPKRATS